MRLAARLLRAGLIMTETTQPAAQGPAFDSARAMEFARSEVFERTFREGMGLVEETAAYLDGPGRAAAKKLSRAAALAYAGESMRLTTRLMQVASWLLVQRAVREGEIALSEAGAEKYRLITRDPGAASATFAGADDLPESLKTLIIRGAAIFERVRRLDETMYGEGAFEHGANPVSDQIAKLQAAFGK
jgi:regulator of CtrA degradation